MFQYTYRIADRYDRPVLSVAILADEHARWRPTHFAQELLGCGVQLHYPVVKLLDWRTRDAELAASKNPFAVLVRAHLGAQAARARPEEGVRTKVALLWGVQRLGHAPEQVVELLRLIDWLLALPPEAEARVQREIAALEEEAQMAYVTSWERMALERGRSEGKAEGQRELLRRIILARFGAVPEQLEERIAAADQEALEHLAERLATAATLDEALST